MDKQVNCAVCDQPIPYGAVGWFCSQTCDDAELTRCRESAKLAAQDAAKPAA
jgi:endogenous inhibitor of DNA gyrase (YacG/DUF329 family)